MNRFIDNKWEIIKKYVKNKKVLDLGCVGYPPFSDFLEHKWLHGLINETTRNLVGVDIDENGVKNMKKMGFDVYVGDVGAPDFNLNKKFDVVNCSRIMQYIANQRTFINNVKKHLMLGGILIIITPNVHDIAIIINKLLGRNGNENRSYPMWHSIGTLEQLLMKNNFDIIDYKYTFNPWVGKFKRKFLKMFYYVFNDFSGSLIVIAKLRDK